MRHGPKEIVLSAVLVCAVYSQISPEKEIALGQRLAAEIDSKQKMIEDAGVIKYVEGVLKNLSRDESLRLPLKLKVIDNSDLVASALPGGFLLLSSGAILRADNEAELAGLLAHAMGHVQAGQSRNARSTGTGVPVVFVGGPWGACIRAGESAGRTLVPLASLPQTDLFESQADLLALGYMTSAGYDPQALVTIFDRWAGKFGPDEEVESRASALSIIAATTVLNTSAFDEIKARLAPPHSSRRVRALSN
jgi:predicted Zn-dependent protease